MVSYDSILCAEPNSSPHEVSGRFISPKPPQIKKYDVWIYNFTWKHLSSWWSLVLCEQKSWSCVFPSYINFLLCLTIPKWQYKKKATETSLKKFPEGKQVNVGMEASKPNQTRWEWHHNAFTPSLHLVPFCQLCTPQNSLHALSLFHMHWMNKVLSFGHSTILHIKYDPICHVQQQ